MIEFPWEHSYCEQNLIRIQQIMRNEAAARRNIAGMFGAMMQ